MSQKSIVSFKSFCEQQEYFLLVALLALGLIVRLVLIFSVTEPIDRDAQEYYKIAQNLLAGKGFSINGSELTARRAPGYPVFLASLMEIFGTEPRILYLAQAIVNILTIFLVFLALKKTEVNLPTRLLITLVFSLSTSFIFVNVLYAEILTMLIVALLLYISIHPDFNVRPSIQLLFGGILTGALIYLRPTFLYFPIFLLFGAIFLKTIRRNLAIKKFLTIAGIALLTLTPWTIRNYKVFHRFIPLVSAGGSELWGANLEIADRFVWNSVSDIQKYEEQRTANHTLQNRLIHEYRVKYKITDPETLNRFLLKQAKQIILQHPFRYALLCFNRLLIFWFSPPIGSMTLKTISPVLFWSILILKYMLTILGIIGLYRFTRNNFPSASLVIMLVIYSTLLHTTIHAIQRYFLPLIPVVYFGLGYFLDTQEQVNKKQPTSSG